MPEVRLSAGPVEYVDTGGAGPVVVLLHGVMMDESVWRHVLADLRRDHRCILPTLPLGGHRQPMDPGADLSLRGIARLVGEFLERLDLRDVVLVNTDWGGSQVLVAEGGAGRVGRLVLVSCEAFDNYPPGLPGRMLAMAARLPGGLAMSTRALRFGVLRRLPLTLGWMSKRPVPADVIDRWTRPLRTRPEIRKDFRRYALSVPPKAELAEIAAALSGFDRPALVVWAAEDRIMPPEHGRRLAELLPQGRLVEVPDSYTLVSEDQPARLAELIRDFARAPAGAGDVP